jgi:hypothetical protein
MKQDYKQVLPPAKQRCNMKMLSWACNVLCCCDIFTINAARTLFFREQYVKNKSFLICLILYTTGIVHLSTYSTLTICSNLTSVPKPKTVQTMATALIWNVTSDMYQNFREICHVLPTSRTILWSWDDVSCQKTRRHFAKDNNPPLSTFRTSHAISCTSPLIDYVCIIKLWKRTRLPVGVHLNNP